MRCAILILVPMSNDDRYTPTPHLTTLHHTMPRRAALYRTLHYHHTKASTLRHANVQVARRIDYLQNRLVGSSGPWHSTNQLLTDQYCVLCLRVT